jgi:hypothetical protein
MTRQLDRDIASLELHAVLLAAHLAPSVATLNGVATEILSDLPRGADAGEVKTIVLRHLRDELTKAKDDPIRRSMVNDLWREYAGIPEGRPDDGQARHESEPGTWTRARRALSRRFYSPAWLAFGLVLCTSAIYVLLAGFWAYTAAYRTEILKGFAVVGLTLLPAFLYLRFVRFRLDPVREEYVYNLHRLGVDRVRNLPRPPRTSEAWQRWVDDGGYLRASEGYNVYEQKFRTQYGRWPSSGGRSNESTERADASQWYAESLGNLTAIYGCTALVGAGWATVVWTLPTTLEPPGPELADLLRFGFLGAYFFVVSTLMRRFFQNDLRPGAYLGAIIRFVAVLVLLPAVHQALTATHAKPAAQYSVAFLIGVFPTVGMQLLRKAVSAITGVIRGGLEPPMPLRQLDGMDIWTEARLLEVGIEDVQHFATTNMVDTLLATRIPSQRLVDWVDQSLLLCRAGLPGFPNTDWKKKGSEDTTYQQLRKIGIRTASDLNYFIESLKYLLPDSADFAGDASPLQSLAKVTPPDNGPSLLCRAAVINVALSKDPNLRLIKNWQNYEHESASRRCDYGLSAAPYTRSVIAHKRRPKQWSRLIGRSDEGAVGCTNGARLRTDRWLTDADKSLA